MSITSACMCTDFLLSRLFFATGLSEPVSLNACACALRKVCEDASSVIYEPSNLEILMWIGEVTLVFFNVLCIQMFQASHFSKNNDSYCS